MLVGLPVLWMEELLGEAAGAGRAARISRRCPRSRAQPAVTDAVLLPTGHGSAPRSSALLLLSVGCSLLFIIPALRTAARDASALETSVQEASARKDLRQLGGRPSVAEMLLVSLLLLLR